MTKISLREYNRKIEMLIGNHDIDNSIHTCLNILNEYPKHVDTHRLLGKALLENQQYESAKLVFEKILEVYPDDLIAHIGLSCIHENEDNLIKSIEHLEKAFENQPANTIFREELKRLRLKKDGIEPSQIQLTRGALVKMYSRSGLYSQAIAEIKLGLHEHPNRIDFKVELAKMHDCNKEVIEAIENCIEIIGMLPYCYEANRILYERLPESSGAMDVRLYRKRLIELDPYYQYVSSKITSVNDVPDMAVIVNTSEIKSPINLGDMDWKQKIDQYWEESSDWMTSTEIENEINWDDLIDKHFAQTKINTSMEDTRSIDTKEKSIDSPTIEKFKDEVSIPDWIFDGESKIVNGKNNINNRIFEDNFNLTSVNEEVESEDINIVDKDAPISSTKKSDPSEWVKEKPENGTINPEMKNEKKIEDTKETSVQIDPEGLLLEGRRALKGENIDYALKKYRDLLIYDQFIPKIINDLTEAYVRYAQNHEFYTILGDAYARSGDLKSALQEYKKAEKLMEI